MTTWAPREGAEVWFEKFAHNRCAAGGVDVREGVVATRAGRGAADVRVRAAARGWHAGLIVYAAARERGCAGSARRVGRARGVWAEVRRVSGRRWGCSRHGADAPAPAGGDSVRARAPAQSSVPTNSGGGWPFRVSTVYAVARRAQSASRATFHVKHIGPVVLSRRSVARYRTRPSRPRREGACLPVVGLPAQRLANPGQRLRTAAPSPYRPVGGRERWCTQRALGVIVGRHMRRIDPRERRAGSYRGRQLVSPTPRPSRVPD